VTSQLLTVQCDVYELLQLTAQYARVFGIQSASSSANRFPAEALHDLRGLHIHSVDYELYDN
jgi:hypothetical protein